MTDLSALAEIESQILADLIVGPFSDLLPILRKYADFRFIHPREARLFFSTFIDDHPQGDVNQRALRSSTPFVVDRMLFLPLAYCVGDRKLFGGAYCLPLDSDEVAPLPHALHEALRLRHESQALRPFLRTLQQLAYTDALTNLGNRRARKEYLERYDHYALLAIDVNRFKWLNDSFGHEHGNSVLAELGVLFERFCNRPNDRAFRWGGEEFSIVLPGTSVADAKHIAEQLYRRVVSHTFDTSSIDQTNSSQYPYPASCVTISLGVVSASPKVHQLADAQLYAAKAIQRTREALELSPLDTSHAFPIR